MRSEIKRSKIFDEFTKEEQQKYFYCKEDKAINNIDTLYYSIFIVDDYNESPKLQLLIDDIFSHVNLLEKSSKTSIDFKNNTELQVFKKSFSIYKLCIGQSEFYDAFIATYLPNINTPRIVVQLRSIALWTKGAEYALIESYWKVSKLLESYGLTIKATRENRIDYAYHSNCIQNPQVYFSDLPLRQYCVSAFKNYIKVGQIGENMMTYDYVAFGNRTSNNVFVRIYNKSREVIELNYKCIFFQIWKEHELISSYDKFIYEYCYNAKSFSQISIAQCKWYIEHGKSEELKAQCKLWIINYIKSPAQLEKIVKGIFPKLTIIYNVEFQTKRKFYEKSDNMINLLPTFNTTDTPLYRVYQIIDNRKLFLDYLTCHSLRFVKDNSEKVNFKVGEKPSYLRWWNIIRSNKVTKYVDYELKREYSRSLEVEKIKKQIINKISTLAIYKNKSDSGDFKEDISDLLCVLNDNDMEQNLVIVDSTTGEIANYKNSFEYKLKKEQKYKSLKTLLNPSSPTLK